MLALASPGSMRPPGPLRIRRGIPLTEHLLAAVVWDGVNARDVAANKGLVLGGSPLGGHTIAGPAGIADAVGDYWDFGAEGTAVRIPTTRITFAALFQWPDTTQRDSVFFGAFTTGTAAVNLESWSGGQGTSIWDFGGNSGNNRLQPTFTKRANIPQTVVVTAGLRGLYAYQNGLLLASKTTAVTRTTNTQGLNINRSGAGSFNGDLIAFNLVLLLEQEWTPTQVREWTVAPWSSVFDPPQRRFGVVGAVTPPEPLDLVLMGTPQYAHRAG